MGYFNEQTDSYQFLKSLTEDLVKIPSMVRTPWEREFAFALFDRLNSIPYFKTHPDQLQMVPLKDDPLNRHCLFAFMEGEGRSSDTLILLSHYDTVGIDDYGELSDWALDPAELKKKMGNRYYPDKIKADLDSGDWLFGRGSVDMKSGIALHLWLLSQFGLERHHLHGNLLFISVPDEEAMNKGAQMAAGMLQEIAEEHKLRFVGLINTDYTAPRYEGDPHRYIYLGSIGKCLLSFFVGGAATHAGECLEGLDANLLTSGLVSRISMNTDLSEETEGEITPPPVSLKQSDLKSVYDVQTPYESMVYFNCFTFSGTPGRILSLAKTEAANTIRGLNERLNSHRRNYAKGCGIPFLPKDLEPAIFSYQEFLNRVASENPGLRSELQEAEKNFPLDESNETKLSLHLVQKVFKRSAEFRENRPCIIIYFSPPYIPPAEVQRNPEGERFCRAIRETLRDQKDDILVKPFFPYISDMSWFGMSAGTSEIRCLKDNAPGFGRTCAVDLEILSGLKIPTANIGPYGKDAHRATERLFMPYSFGILPHLLLTTVRNLLSQSRS